MIRAKQSLVGAISTKQSLLGSLNTGVEKIYPELEDITITPTKEEQHFKSDKYGYGSITVEKVSDEYIIPTGDLEINSNGTYDVKEKANAIVNVPEKQLGTKTITKNGVYNATDDNLDGYSSVDVQTSGADLNEYFDMTTAITTPENSQSMINRLIKKIPSNITIPTNMSYAFYNCERLTEVPLLDTSNVTLMENMFNGCIYLTEVPLFNTSSVTSMNSMFSGCTNLTTVPQFDTSNVTKMESMFHSCKNLTEVPQFDTSNVTTVYSMFNGCTSLTTIPLLNIQNAKAISNMFAYCSGLTTIPQLNTSSATSMASMFTNCNKLTTIPLLEAPNVTNVSSMFSSCYALTTLGGFKNLGMAYLTTRSANYSSYTLNLSSCSKLTHDSLMNVINNLYDIASAGVQPQKLQLGTTNLNKLSDEEKLLAQNKGWSLS